MKILFCDNSLRELLHFRGTVIDHFIKEGNEVLLVAPVNINPPSRKGCKVIDVRLQRGGMSVLNDLRFIRSLYSIYKRERPDYIFHYTIKPNIYGSISSRMLGIPSAAMISGLGYAFHHNDFRSKMARLLFKLGLRFATDVLVLNQGNLDTLLNRGYLNPEKVILLKGGEGLDLIKYS